MWPDMAKFRHFGKVQKLLEIVWEIISYLVKFWIYFGKTYAIRHLLISKLGQLFRKQYSHLVTLFVIID